MEPPICAVCRRRFDPSGGSQPDGSGLVRFADHRPLPDGMTGHPAGTAWFCRRHYGGASSLRDRPLPDALALLRRRRWRRVSWLAGLALLPVVAGASAWSAPASGLVSPRSLWVLAATCLVLAAAVGRLRGVGLRPALADGRAAAGGSTLALAVSIALFAAAQPLTAPPAWSVAGSAALLASPLAATLALRRRCRRSTPRALVASALALAGVVVWLTLNLRGPRGGWTLLELAQVLPAAVLAVASAACLGWWSKRAAAARRAAGTLLLLLAALPGALACGAGDPPRAAAGTLVLTLRDAATGAPTPARVELVDERGEAHVPADALAVSAACASGPLDVWVPGSGVVQDLWGGERRVANPYTGTTQFYAGGPVRAELPAGTYSVRATKGPEYRTAAATIAVAAGEVTSVGLDLERWVDLASEGWYGADDHLHIPRSHPRFDPRIATWMEAEGLHVANLLQMGLARDVHVTPQHGFGPSAAYQRGDTLLLSGQENPRTHVLGHAITLGAHRFLDLPRHYLLYDRIWREAHRHGAVNGYAHWGLAGAEEGLAVWGHRALLDFVEVLNLGFPFYDRWYEALDLGLRLGPTAGTDYPCVPGLPGRERFYARLEGPLGAAAWLDAVRLGRTFVTNGPAIELAVDGVGPGDELRLPGPAAVRVAGRVRFDPERDRVTALELIRGGEVVARAEEAPAPAEIRLETTLEIDRTSWVALRATGSKRGETRIDLRGFFAGMLVLERASNEAVIASLPEGTVERPSAAHTAAVLVTVEGTAPLASQPRGRAVARLWRARLDELEGRLDDERMAGWARFPGRGDGIELRTARANRAALLDAIEAARRHYGR